MYIPEYFLMSFSYGFCSVIVYLLAKDILKKELIVFVIFLSYLLYSPLHYVNIGQLDANTFFRFFCFPLLFSEVYFGGRGIYFKQFSMPKRF